LELLVVVTALKRLGAIELDHLRESLGFDGVGASDAEVLAALHKLERQGAVRESVGHKWYVPGYVKPLADPHTGPLRLPLDEVGTGGRDLLVFTGAGSGDSSAHWKATIMSELRPADMQAVLGAKMELYTPLFDSGPVWAWGSKTEDSAHGVAPGDVVLAYGPTKTIEFGFVVAAKLRSDDFWQRFWVADREPEPYSNVVLLVSRTPARPRIPRDQFLDLWGYRAPPQGWARPKVGRSQVDVARSLIPYFTQ
jgi:hypothetical protein